MTVHLDSVVYDLYITLPCWDICIEYCMTSPLMFLPARILCICGVPPRVAEPLELEMLAAYPYINII